MKVSDDGVVLVFLGYENGMSFIPGCWGYKS